MDSTNRSNKQQRQPKRMFDKAPTDPFRKACVRLGMEYQLTWKQLNRMMGYDPYACDALQQRLNARTDPEERKDWEDCESYCEDLGRQLQLADKSYEAVYNRLCELVEALDRHHQLELHEGDHYAALSSQTKEARLLWKALMEQSRREEENEFLLPLTNPSDNREERLTRSIVVNRQWIEGRKARESKLREIEPDLRALSDRVRLALYQPTLRQEAEQKAKDRLQLKEQENREEAEWLERRTYCPRERLEDEDSSEDSKY